MQEIIPLFTQKYGLTTNEVIAEIEKVLSTILSRWYRCEVMVIFGHDLQLEAVAYNKRDGVILQKSIDLTTIRGENSLKRHLEYSLFQAAVLKQTKQYKCYEKQIRWGEITAIDDDRNYHVEIEIIPGKTVTAICPLNRVGLHDQNAPYFSVGKNRAFHIRRVDPVLLNGTPRLKVIVDRVSKSLVEALLRKQLGLAAEDITICCTKRFVGHKSFVLTSKKLPKSAIIAVTNELSETMEVRFLKSV